MHKTTTITLAGQLFNLTEEAYGKLKRYLDAVRAYFVETSDESDEIMGDIEARIAELLLGERATPGKVVSEQDVEEIIKHLGTVEDIAAFDQESEGTSAGAHHQEGVKKRFYRDPSNAMLGGVASGIAAYFDVDPTIVRLAFVILAFLNGIGILVYVILWILLPEARTPAERAEMTGEDITLATLQTRLRQTANQMKQEFNAKEVRSASARAFNSAKRTSAPLLRFINGILRLVLVLIGLGILLAAFTGLVIAVMIAIAILFNQLPSFVEFPILDLIYGTASFFALLGTWSLAAVIPLAGGILLGWYLLKRQTLIGGNELLAMVATWIVAVVATVALAMHIFPPHYATLEAQVDRSISERVIPIEGEFSEIEIGDYGDFEISVGTTTRIVARGTQTSLDELDIDVSRGILRAHTNWGDDRVCIFCPREPRELTLLITVPTLNGIETSGSVSGSVTGFTTDEFTINTYGSSEVELEVTSDILTAEQTGASEITVLGNHESLILSMRGASTFTLVANPVTRAEVETEDASEAIIAVEEMLGGQARDTSDITYFGEPEVSIDEERSATVRARGDGTIMQQPAAPEAPTPPQLP